MGCYRPYSVESQPADEVYCRVLLTKHPATDDENKLLREKIEEMKYKEGLLKGDTMAIVIISSVKKMTIFYNPVVTVAAVADISSIKAKLAVDAYTLNVADLDQTSYREFIEMLCKVLSIKKDPPVPPLAANPPQCFDLKLTADMKVTTIRFQNTTSTGYQAQIPLKNWFELRRTADVLLGYSNDDGDLVRASYKSVTEASLTQQAFYTAVSTLANSKIPKNSSVKDNHERARALILMAQMVSEACRFVDISVI